MEKMRRTFRNHAWVAVLSLALATPITSRAAGVHVDFGPSPLEVQSGATFTVPLRVFQAGDPFNAFDANVYFDPARLTYVPTSPTTAQIGPLITNACGSNYHRFVLHSNYLEISLSMLCANTTVTGPGTIYMVKFRSTGSDTGESTISYGAGTQFYKGGLNVNPLDAKTLKVHVSNTPLPVSIGTYTGGLRMEAPSPNPRIGAGPERFEFSLPAAGPVTVEVFDFQGRRVAGRGPLAFERGPNRLVLSLPELPAGTYFARLTTLQGVVGRRWVVLR
jgi:hypothetical protein